MALSRSSLTSHSIRDTPPPAQKTSSSECCGACSWGPVSRTRIALPPLGLASADGNEGLLHEGFFIFNLCSRNINRSQAKRREEKKRRVGMETQRTSFPCCAATCLCASISDTSCVPKPHVNVVVVRISEAIEPLHREKKRCPSKTSSHAMCYDDAPCPLRSFSRCVWTPSAIAPPPRPRRPRTKPRCRRSPYRPIREAIPSFTCDCSEKMVC